MGFLDKLLGTSSESKLKKLRPKVAAINALEPEMKKLTDEQLRHKTVEFRERRCRTLVLMGCLFSSRNVKLQSSGGTVHSQYISPTGTSAVQ